MGSFLYHGPPIHQVSPKSVQDFLSNATNKQTNKQTKWTQVIAEPPWHRIAAISHMHKISAGRFSMNFGKFDRDFKKSSRETSQTTISDIHKSVQSPVHSIIDCLGNYSPDCGKSSNSHTDTLSDCLHWPSKEKFPLLLLLHSFNNTTYIFHMMNICITHYM